MLPTVPLPISMVTDETTKAASTMSATSLPSIVGIDEVDRSELNTPICNTNNFSSVITPSSPASTKTTTSSMRPTSHPSATYSITSRSPSPAYSNPNSVTSSQDVILSEPGCGSGRPSVDSPAISATYSEGGHDASDGVSQTSSVDQELKEEIQFSIAESHPGTTTTTTTSVPIQKSDTVQELGLKVPVSEIDPSILPKTFNIKAKNVGGANNLPIMNRSGGAATGKAAPSTTLINKMRAPRGTVNVERSQEICRTAIAKSPNWVQVDPSVVRTALQQTGNTPQTTIADTPICSGTNVIVGGTNKVMPLVTPAANNVQNTIAVLPPAQASTSGNTTVAGPVQIMTLPSTATNTTIAQLINRGVVVTTTGPNFANTVLVNKLTNTVSWASNRNLHCIYFNWSNN